MPLPSTESPVQTASERQRLKLAHFILAKITRTARAPSERILHSLRELGNLKGVLEKAHQHLVFCSERGWHVAAQFQAERIHGFSNDLLSTANTLNELAQALSTGPSVQAQPPSVRDILSDLQQLETEFDHVEIDYRQRTIAVRTEPINLEGRYLGPFEIVLKLADLAHARRGAIYKVVAIDPHPANTNDAVTHPHVRNEELCEGEATNPLRHALESGRILDFFILVRSVLQTYNSGSPYVSLDDWEGIACHDCGYVASDDDRSYCEGCSHDFCNDCMSYCRSCDTSRCQSCLETCPACDSSTCGRCLLECEECGESVCKSCLENNVCPDCREKAEEPDESANTFTTPTSGEPTQSDSTHSQAA